MSLIVGHDSPAAHHVAAEIVRSSRPACRLWTLSDDEWRKAIPLTLRETGTDRVIQILPVAPIRRKHPTAPLVQMQMVL